MAEEDWVGDYDAQVQVDGGEIPSDIDKRTAAMSMEDGYRPTYQPRGRGNNRQGNAYFSAPPPQHSFGATQGAGRGFAQPHYASGPGGFNPQGGGYPGGRGHYQNQQGFQGPPRGRGAMRGGRGGGFAQGDGEYAQPYQQRLPTGPSSYKWQAQELPKSQPQTDEEIESIEKPMTSEEIALLNKFLHKTVNLMKNDTVDVEKQQLDPRSPLHSLAKFRDLRIREELLKALDIMGFQQPSKIQEFALPLLLMEPPTNMIAQSQSGTGKTAAFVLTMLSRINISNQYPQCLCLAPTFELAKQIGEVITKMAMFMPGVTVHYAVKGSRIARGSQLSDQIIIGTPGKVIDYLTKNRCFDPSKIICLVLDEADVMISQQGHLDLSMRIYNVIEEASPHVQRMLFSATYDAPVIAFAENLIKDAVSVTLKREEQSLPNIKQFYVECSGREAKYQAVVDLYSGIAIASAVIFTHTKFSSEWLEKKMKSKGHEVCLLHGGLAVEDRARVIQEFKDGLYKVMITTNLCARGIDVSQVSIVINYDPPTLHDCPTEPDYDTYLHRIGRTGRFGKAGIAINFVDSQESLQIIEKIGKHFDKPIIKLDPGDIEQLEAIDRD